MHGIENVRSECSKFSLIFTCLWGNVILWSQGSCWSVCSSKDQTALLSRKAGRLWPERCSGLGARWRPWEEKCPVIYTSLLSLPLQQPKPNPAGADRAPFSLSLTINFSCCFCFLLWHFSAPAGSQCRKLTLLRNQKRNQCWCNKLSQLSVGVRQEGMNGETTATLAEVGWKAPPVSPSLQWEWFMQSREWKVPWWVFVLCSCFTGV